VHQKLLVGFSFPLVFSYISTGQKIFTQDVIVHQAHAYLIGQRETPALILRLHGGCGGEILSGLSRRRRAARG
jgi:hypothetical protein